VYDDAAASEAASIRLAAGPLSAALIALAEQAGVSIVFDARRVDGFDAEALDGAFSVETALDALIADSPFRWRRVGRSAFAIAAAPLEPPAEDKIAAVAPEEERALQDEILVTASYRPPDLRNDRVLYTLDAEQLRLGGAINVAEPITELPAAVATITAANTAFLPSAAGLNLADLRGFGPQRTLVLVNGRPFVRTSGGNGDIFGVDLNSIAAPFVERIEIIDQGAGATLGPTAAAGAVNIVLRAPHQGLTATVDGGVSARGDAAEYAVSLLGGATAGRARFTAGASFTADPELLAGDRDDTARPFGFGPDGFARQRGGTGEEQRVQEPRQVRQPEVVGA